MGVSEHVGVEVVQTHCSTNGFDQLVCVGVSHWATDGCAREVDEHVVTVHVGDLSEEVRGVEIEESPRRIDAELCSLLRQHPILVVLSPVYSHLSTHQIEVAVPQPECLPYSESKVVESREQQSVAICRGGCQDLPKSDSKSIVLTVSAGLRLGRVSRDTSLVFRCSMCARKL